VTFTYAPPPPPPAATTAPPAGTPAPEPAEPAEAAVESSTADPAGIPVWVVVAGAAVVLAGAILAVRRSRSRT
jgi:hypothetical protein